MMPGRNLKRVLLACQPEGEQAAALAVSREGGSHS